jgi:hypothetical protein
VGGGGGGGGGGRGAEGGGERGNGWGKGVGVEVSEWVSGSEVSVVCMMSPGWRGWEWGGLSMPTQGLVGGWENGGLGGGLYQSVGVGVWGEMGWVEGTGSRGSGGRLGSVDVCYLRGVVGYL